MAKLKSLSDLKKLGDSLKSTIELREKGENSENLVQIKVAMATCGIASGAREVMNLFIEEFAERKMNNTVVTQTGCMGYCYAEPTVEVKLPNESPLVFGNVDNTKVIEIIEKYIAEGELIEGIIPINYETVDKK